MKVCPTESLQWHRGSWEKLPFQCRELREDTNRAQFLCTSLSPASTGKTHTQMNTTPTPRMASPIVKLRVDNQEGPTKVSRNSLNFGISPVTKIQSFRAASFLLLPVDQLLLFCHACNSFKCTLAIKNMIVGGRQTSEEAAEVCCKLLS